MNKPLKTDMIGGVVGIALASFVFPYHSNNVVYANNHQRNSVNDKHTVDKVDNYKYLYTTIG